MQGGSTSSNTAKDQGILTQSMIEMIEIIEHAIDLEMEKDASPAALANASVVALCRVLGGTAVYLPRATALKKMERDRQIFKDYRDGMTIPDILKKHKISSQTFYSIIRAQRSSARLPQTVQEQKNDIS